MRILYIDPSLSSPLGHHANVTVNVVTALRALGHDVCVLGNVAAKNIDIDVERVFSKSIYRHIHIDPIGIWDLLARSSIAHYESEVLVPLARFGPDLIYAQSVTGIVLAALMRAIDRLYPSGQRPKLVVELPFSNSAEGGKTYVGQIRQALENASSQSLAHTKLITVNAQTSAMLSATIEWPVDVFPSPYRLEPVQNSKHGRGHERKDGRNLVIGVIGHQQAAKGIGLVPDILRAALSETSFAKFIVQLQPGIDSAIRAPLHEMAAETGRIFIEERSLLKNEYEALAHSLNVFLLPYDPKAYRSMVSGVAYEALSCGGVIIAPAETPIASLVARYQGTEGLFAPWTVNAIAKTLAHVLSNFDRLAGLAEEGRIRYLEENGPMAMAHALLSQTAAQPPMTPLLTKARALSLRAKAEQTITKARFRFKRFMIPRRPPSV